MAEVEIGIGQVGPAGLRASTTSPSSPAAAPATPRTSTSPGRSTPSASSCRSWPRPWTAWSARPPPSRSAASAASACSTSRACGPATRTPSRCFEEIADARRPRRPPGACRRSTPSRSSPSSIGQRIREIKDAGVVAAASVTPQRTEQLRQADPRRRARPARHPGHRRLGRARLQDRRAAEPQEVHPRARHAGHRRRLRLATRPRCTSCAPAPSACSSASAPGHACTTRGVLGIGVPQATAIADARAARMRHLDETGVYVHVIADGGMAHRRRHRQGHRLRRRRRDDRLAARRRRTRRPGRGYHWGMATFHPTLPRGARVADERPGHARGDPRRPGPRERRPHATCSAPCARRWPPCGYETVKEFQKAEVMVAPALQTEGKALQRRQGVGMGH